VCGSVHHPRREFVLKNPTVVETTTKMNHLFLCGQIFSVIWNLNSARYTLQVCSSDRNDMMSSGVIFTIIPMLLEQHSVVNLHTCKLINFNKNHVSRSNPPMIRKLINWSYIVKNTHAQPLGSMSQCISSAGPKPG